MTKTLGKGDQKRICILFQENGIGDDICALPALWQKIHRDGFSIQIHARGLMREVYERIGCEFVDQNTFYQRIGTMDRLEQEFGTIYALAKYCLEHESSTGGDIYRTRFEQFADMIDTTVPEEFDFKEFLVPGVVQKTEPVIVLAPYSETRCRSYSQAKELFDILHYENDVQLIGMFGQPQLALQDLARTIFNADCVVAIDNGILHFALALQVPSVALFGGSDEWSIIQQYQRFGEVKCKVVRSLREEPDVCQRPCNFTAQRGYGIDSKCTKPGAHADCMNEILPQQILEVTFDFLQQ